MNRQSGSMLVELIVTLTVISLALLGFLSSSVSSFKAIQEVSTRDEVMASFETVTETLRDANFEQFYDNYNGTSLEVPGLEDPYGGPAAVDVTCYIDETSLPAEFGLLYDLDGIGGLDTTDITTTGYKLLPVKLTLDYAASYGTETREMYLILGAN